MAIRSMANTSISFGLVNIPVRVYKATEDRSIGFHQYHGGGCHGAVGQQRVCKTCGELVEYGDIVKGIECEGGDVVIVTPEESAAVERETSAGIEMLQVVAAEEIDPTLCGPVHYLAPDAKSLQGYTLLREALRASDRVAVARYVMRDVAHMAVLRCRGRLLILQQIVWAADIREPEFPILDKPVELDPKTVKVAQQLLESMLGPFNHVEHSDEYVERVEELVTAKAAGAPVAVHTKETGIEDVSDLLAALEKSIANHPAGRKRDNAAPTKTAQKRTPVKVVA